MMRLKAYHDSQDLLYRDPFGAVECGRLIVLRLKTNSPLPVDSCLLRLWEGDRERIINMSPRLKNSDIINEDFGSGTWADSVIFEAEFEANSLGLIWYYFIIQAGSQTYYYGNNPQQLGGEGTLSELEPPSYQITVYKKSAAPEWYKRGIMYQVFVDRFFRSPSKAFSLYPRQNALFHANWSDPPVYIKDKLGRVTDWDFFGGTLQGVLEKLPYFKELGISILYFNPIFDAPSNHKYDTADYHRIDPMYGDETVFRKLLDDARQLGISIILDGVFSHTGSDSIYFNKFGTYPEPGAYQSLNSPYYKWYRFTKDHEYKAWWGVDTLPEVNELELSYRQFIYGSEDSVLNEWLKMGVAGWRLDVADELPDQFIEELRQALKKINQNAVLIGEVWEDASRKVSYGRQRQYLFGNELDATMNYPFRSALLRFILGEGDSADLHQELMSLYENYPRENFYACMNLIGSHDTARILTLLGDAPPEQSLRDTEQRNFRLSPSARQLAAQRLKILSLIQMSFPGVPCLYYGDEAGLEGYSDPYNRGTYPWGQEDSEILNWYRRILRLRNEHETLLTGGFRSFNLDPDVYGFIRTGDEEEITILLNRHTSDTKTVNISGKLQPASFIIDLLDGQTLVPETLKSMPVKPLQARALLSRAKRLYNLKLDRSCGVLLHISSLPSVWGLGDLGKEAYQFVDFLADCAQSLWQVLPLNPAGVGDCPYQSDSAFAGNPYFINIDYLISEGLLNLEESREKYAKIMRLDLRRSLLALALKDLKYSLLREAYQQFIRQIALDINELTASAKSAYLAKENFLEFQAENKEWLEDYARFKALKSHFGEGPWYEWDSEIAMREAEALTKYDELLHEEIGFIKFVQYTFFYQWAKIKTYAQSKGVRLIGDLPYFVAADSCDVWVNRSLFILDERGRPAKSAGVPPDYFSKTGQLWGNPIYNWDALAKTQYAWWKKRIQFSLELYDYLRLDHFRGFEAYWEVDAAEVTAENGRWIKGPGRRFFESLLEAFGRCPFIVEDLGYLTSEVNILKQIFGFPGLKVLQFTPLQEILGDAETNFVYYTGTHDNNTLLGWYEKNHYPEGVIQDSSSKEQHTPSQQACQELTEEVYASQAGWVILPMQDILGLGEEARMNVPGTIYGNWLWQMNKDSITDEIKTWLRTQAEKTERYKSKKE